MTPDLPRLRETLGLPALARLVQRLRRRLEFGRRLEGVMVLRDPTLEERDAIERLLGRRPARGAVISLSLEALDARLRHAELCDGLAHAVELLTGPVKNLRTEEALDRERWDAVFARSSQRIERAELQAWLEELRTTGLLRRIAANNLAMAAALLDDALHVIARLPAQGVPLAKLAAESSSNSHALDANTRLGTLVIRAAAALGGVERWDDAETRRDAWAGVGVLCDELSAPVLLLNLRAAPDTPTGISLQTYAAAGEPCLLTIRQLLQNPPVFRAGENGDTVFVCENPTVVAAAANLLGAKSSPIVCLNGQPKTAARLLLASLRSAGVELAYHGDFDWPGLQIANLIHKRHGATPWRMSASDYLAALSSFSGGEENCLKGELVTASWDADLAPAMVRCDRAIHEEQVLDTLLSDLGTA